MDEALIQAVLSRVLDLWNPDPGPVPVTNGPRALLLGHRPRQDMGYTYVQKEPWEAVVLGSVTMGQLLGEGLGPVYDALAQGKPVYLVQEGLPRCPSGNRKLEAEAMAAVGHLKALGVRLVGEGTGKKLVTAREARLLKAQGIGVPAGAVLTPLAREILEG